MNILKTYLEKVIQAGRVVDARGMLQAEELVELSLNDIFVPCNITLPDEIPNPEHHRDIELQQNIAELRDLPMQETDSEFLLRDKFMHLQQSGLPLETLWEQPGHWVLLGEPGAGKTTLLKHIALTQARRLVRDDSGNLPIFFKLKDFADSWQRHSRTWVVEDALLNYLSEYTPDGMAFETEQERQLLLDRMQYALETHSCTLLCDALEQIRSLEMRHACVEAIEHVLNKYPGNQCLLTTQPGTYQKEWVRHSFRLVQIEAFNSEQIQHFFRQWFMALEKLEDLMVDENTYRRANLKADPIIKQMLEKPRICSNKANPLLCTLVVLVQRRAGNLPEQRIELYQLCVDSLLVNWENNRRLIALDKPKLERNETLFLLENLALYMRSQENPRPLGSAEVEQISLDFLQQQGIEVNQATQQARCFVQYLSVDAGLVNRYGENEFAFSHSIFEEYLAARAITNDPKKIEYYLENYLFSPEWRNIIQLAAAHQGMKSEALGSAFIKLIQQYPHQREAQMHYAFRFAFQCLSETRVSFQVADQMFRQWVQIYTQQPELQPALNRLLSKTSNLQYQAKAITPLLDAIKDKDLSVRNRAVEALGYLKDPNGLSMLLDVLKNDAQPLVRAKAAEVLGEFQDPESVPALLFSLRNDNAFFVRHRAAQAVARFRHPTILPALLQSLHDDDATVRWRATEALGHIKTPNALQALQQVLREDHIAGVRWRVVEALGLMKNPAALGTLLEVLENDTDANVRSRVAEALGNFNSLQVMPALLDVLKNDRFPAIRWRAAEALGRLKERITVPALLNALKDDVDNAVRWSAAEALGRIGDSQAVPKLINTLKRDTDPAVRWSAAEALGHLRDLSAVEALLSALHQDKYPSVRAKVCQALGFLKDQSATPVLLKILNEDSEASVRRRAAEALGYLQNPSAISSLIDALNHDNESGVRWSAAKSLGTLKSSIKNPQCIESLVNCLQHDEDICVRWRAAKSLELIDLGRML